MKNLLAIAALLSATSAGAVSFSSVGGAPDPGPTANQNLLLTFDGANPTGWSWSAGTLATSPSSIPGAAAPAGDVTTFGYVSSASASNFATLSFAEALRSVSFYWGSIDTYNFVDVLGPGGSLLATISGSQLPPASGNQAASDTNRRIFIDGDGAFITGLTFRSTGIAFEFDDIAGNAVPEPGTLALLGLGLAGLGLSRRRKTV